MQKTVNAPTLMVRRAEAIQAYASIEYSLAMVLMVLLEKNDPNIGFSLISRMVNARSRSHLIEDLLSQSDVAELSASWKRLAKKLSEVDGVRNKIVHWNYVQSEKNGEIENYLMPWSAFSGQTQEKMNLSEVELFISKANQMASMISVFSGYKLADANTRTALADIFNLPIDENFLKAYGERIQQLSVPAN